VRTALVRTLKHRKRHETVTTDSSRAPSVYVLEVAVVMGRHELEEKALGHFDLEVAA
jgi:hypothetical protein